MVPLDKALATSYIGLLSIVTICRGLAAIFNGKFEVIRGHIWKTVRNRTKVTINH